MKKCTLKMTCSRKNCLVPIASLVILLIAANVIMIRNNESRRVSASPKHPGTSPNVLDKDAKRNRSVHFSTPLARIWSKRGGLAACIEPLLVVTLCLPALGLEHFRATGWPIGPS